MKYDVWMHMCPSVEPLSTKFDQIWEDEEEEENGEIGSGEGEREKEEWKMAGVWKWDELVEGFFEGTGTTNSIGRLFSSNTATHILIREWHKKRNIFDVVS